MNINELIEQMGGRERLEFLSEYRPNVVKGQVTFREVKLMARSLLSVLDAKPVGYFRNDARAVFRVWPTASDDCNNPAYTIPPAARAPDGWKLVPLKASPEILQAGIKAHYERQKHQKPEDVEFKGPMECAYDDMLSAAPAPEGDGG